VEKQSLTIKLCEYLVDDWVLVKEEEIEAGLWEIA